MILIVNNHSKNVPYIKDILDKLNVKYIVKDQKSLFKNFEEKNIKGVILSGGGPLLDKKIHFKKIRADISCLINYTVPILGICEGHEIIGHACGGELVKLKKKARYTNLKLNILNKTKIFKGLPDTIEVYEHHSRYVKNVPDDLIIAASSKKDKIEAVFHKKRPIFGVQFHPEKSGKAGEKIFKNFIGLCK